jgi:hypothetical protein
VIPGGDADLEIVAALGFTLAQNADALHVAEDCRFRPGQRRFVNAENLAVLPGRSG